MGDFLFPVRVRPFGRKTAEIDHGGKRTEFECDSFDNVIREYREAQEVAFRIPGLENLNLGGPSSGAYSEFGFFDFGLLQ
ncbi:MAG: hypothetical protein K6L73_14420 [Cellvibrionaceae bacterium]